ncbi:uncharacterized protein LOC117640424 [Thrips palmi]|uniref:Uncharacterized protein LOC117640424 n=1 Tax=Thrips palmi TaxID=161013 RepID=A0A6P8ZI16_THRPL|nr:uncharacterized protein LOC117640424 [Thrips palmi]
MASLAVRVVVVGALCCVLRSAVQAASCPPLRSTTVLVECQRNGEPFDCTTQPSAPGTVAWFRCRALHQLPFGFPPAAGSESRCEPSGAWSVRPFRCVPICGRPTGRPTALVRDGEAVESAADYPWHVTVYDVTRDMKQICGGSLVTPKFFVSAAHCFHDNDRALPAGQYMAGFAKTKRSANVTEPQAQFRPVAQIHMKDYGARKLHYVNDIALVELEAEVAVTAWTLPVCVDWGQDLPDLRSGEEGTVVGFGDNALAASETLRFARLPFLRREDCQKLVIDKLAIFNLLPDKYCVGFLNNTSVAPGDSGGGMAFPSEDRAWFLRGIVSVGSSTETTYSFFTNVTAFVPWMAGIIRQGVLSSRRCGVDVAESIAVDGATADRQDFPWEVDVYLKWTSNRDFERLWPGVLVKPNLVITSKGRYQSKYEERYSFELSEYPASWFRVASSHNSPPMLADNTGNVSEVVRLFYPEDVISKSGVLFSFALMELKQPLHLMPVCVDWTGSAQLQNGHFGTTYFETPPNNTRVWKRYSLVNASECDYVSKASSAGHHLCIFHQGGESRHRSRSLLVNVDDAWYLRGIWFYSDARRTGGSVAVYTDMSHPDVLQWLDTTEDKLGEPECGHMTLCEPLSSSRTVPGHMPWSVVVGDRQGHPAGPGQLVRFNAVLTTSRVLYRATGSDGTFQAEDTAKILVYITEKNGTSRTASVVRVSVHEEGIHFYSNAVLLELAPEDGASSTPVCLDLSGKVLQPLAPGEMGLIQLWHTWIPANHSMLGTPALSPGDCKRKASVTPNAAYPTRFCFQKLKAAGPPVEQGSGYLVTDGYLWYLQGLIVDNGADLSGSEVRVAADLRNEKLRAWLREKIHELGTPERVHFVDTGRKDCVGGRSSDFQCGVRSKEENSQLAFNTRSWGTQDHMHWNLHVHVDYGDKGWSVHGGALVKPNMVLTSARHLVSETTPNTTAHPISTSHLIVKYTSFVDFTDIRSTRIAEVDRIHLRKRPTIHAQDFSHDLALLVLKTTVDLTPVCLPEPSSLGHELPRLAAGSSGVVEYINDTATSADRGWNRMIPVNLFAAEKCEGVLNDTDDPIHQPQDEFCIVVKDYSGDVVKTIRPLGYPLTVITDGVWYLRGVLGGSWKSDRSFTNLDDPDVLEWLAAEMRDAMPDGPGDKKELEQSTSGTTTSATKVTTAAPMNTTTLRSLPTESPPPNNR